VLHQGELTYALIASGFAASRMQAYQDVCTFLIRGWRSLGVDLAFGTARRGYIHNPNCFGTATAADLVTAEGYKLIGSAQLRRGSSLLQHGSMRLQPDAELMQKIFGSGHSMSPLTLPPPPVTHLSIESIQSALMQAAVQQFGITIEEKPLSAGEWAEVRSLADDPNFSALA
jgi:lipoate-protein ligase A